MVTAVVDPGYGLKKHRLMALLDEQGIDTRPFFHPLSSLPAYADLPQAWLAAQRNFVAYRLSPYGINLPSGLQLTEDDVDRVCSALKCILTSATQPADT
jgi:perosamine synthetase